MASATAAPISRVRRASIARAPAITPLATASNARHAWRIAASATIVEVAAAPVQAHARAVPTSRTTRPTRVRALSI